QLYAGSATTATATRYATDHTDHADTPAGSNRPPSPSASPSGTITAPPASICIPDVRTGDAGRSAYRFNSDPTAHATAAPSTTHAPRGWMPPGADSVATRERRRPIPAPSTSRGPPRRP